MRPLVQTEGHSINALHHRNDYSMVALGGNCYWLLIMLVTAAQEVFDMPDRLCYKCTILASIASEMVA